MNWFSKLKSKLTRKRIVVKSIPLTREHLALRTPKWGRASLRGENRFRRAMKRSEMPLIKRSHCVEFARRGVPGDQLLSTHANHQRLAQYVWEYGKLFTRKHPGYRSKAWKRNHRIASWVTRMLPEDQY